MQIDARVMNILLDVRDAKSERPLCRGIHVFKEGYVTASDGYVAFVSDKASEMPYAIKKDMLIEFETFSLSGINLININDKENVLECLKKAGKDDNGKDKFSLLFKVPFNISAVEPMSFKGQFEKHKRAENGMVNLNPKNMKKISSVFTRSNGVTLYIGEPGTPSIAVGEEGALIIIPVNLTPHRLPGILKN